MSDYEAVIAKALKTGQCYVEEITQTTGLPETVVQNILERFEYLGIVRSFSSINGNQYELVNKD